MTDSDNVLGRLDEIRRIRGLPTFDPTRIEGDGAWPVEPQFDPDLDPPEPRMPQIPEFEPNPEPEPDTSPLVALGSQPVTPAPVAIPNGVVVMDQAASYEGQAVFLSEAERAAICAIVLRALANRIKEQHKELRAKLPRQIRVRRMTAMQAIAEQQPKRKRGRPRKKKSGVESAASGPPD